MDNQPSWPAVPAESTQPGGATWHIIRIVDVFVAVQGWVWIENFADGDETSAKTSLRCPLVQLRTAICVTRMQGGGYSICRRKRVWMIWMASDPLSLALRERFGELQVNWKVDKLLMNHRCPCQAHVCRWNQKLQCLVLQVMFSWMIQILQCQLPTSGVCWCWRLKSSLSIASRWSFKWGKFEETTCRRSKEAAQ